MQVCSFPLPVIDVIDAWTLALWRPFFPSTHFCHWSSFSSTCCGLSSTTVHTHTPTTDQLVRSWFCLFLLQSCRWKWFFPIAKFRRLQLISCDFKIPFYLFSSLPPPSPHPAPFFSFRVLVLVNFTVNWLFFLPWNSFRPTFFFSKKRLHHLQILSCKLSIKLISRRRLIDVFASTFESNARFFLLKSSNGLWSKSWPKWFSCSWIWISIPVATQFSFKLKFAPFFFLFLVWRVHWTLSSQKMSILSLLANELPSVHFPNAVSLWPICFHLPSAILNLILIHFLPHRFVLHLANVWTGRVTFLFTSRLNSGKIGGKEWPHTRTQEKNELFKIQFLLRLGLGRVDPVGNQMTPTWSPFSVSSRG